jgi:hypothetical protein
MRAQTRPPRAPAAMLSALPRACASHHAPHATVLPLRRSRAAALAPPRRAACCAHRSAALPPRSHAPARAATSAAAAAAADTPALDAVCYTLIVDDIVFPDGATAMGVLGGGGPQTCFGLRLHPSSPSVVRADDVPPREGLTWTLRLTRCVMCVCAAGAGCGGGRERLACGVCGVAGCSGCRRGWAGAPARRHAHAARVAGAGARRPPHAGTHARSALTPGAHTHTRPLTPRFPANRCGARRTRPPPFARRSPPSRPTSAPRPPSTWAYIRTWRT